MALTGFFRADKVRGQAGVKFLEPYQPGKIPVLLVHGLLVVAGHLGADVQRSAGRPGPARAVPVLGLLLSDRRPVPGHGRRSAAAISTRSGRISIRTAQDPALDQLVLVGHSMGGLISHLQTVAGGDDFWKLVSDEPIQQVKAEETVKEELQETFYFQPRMDVKRVVFLGTPHRGSRLSPSFPARLAQRFIRAPKDLMVEANDLTALNPTLKYRQLPNSVDLLAPDAPALEVLAERPRPPGVHYHSVIGDGPEVQRAGRALAGRRQRRTRRRRGAGHERPLRRGRFGTGRAGRPFPRPPAPAGGAGSPADSAGTRRRERVAGAAAVTVRVRARFGEAWKSRNVSAKRREPGRHIFSIRILDSAAAIGVYYDGIASHGRPREPLPCRAPRFVPFWPVPAAACRGGRFATTNSRPACKPPTSGSAPAPASANGGSPAMTKPPASLGLTAAQRALEAAKRHGRPTST